MTRSKRRAANSGGKPPPKRRKTIESEESEEEDSMEESSEAEEEPSSEWEEEESSEEEEESGEEEEESSEDPPPPPKKKPRKKAPAKKKVAPKKKVTKVAPKKKKKEEEEEEEEDSDDMLVVQPTKKPPKPPKKKRRSALLEDDGDDDFKSWMAKVNATKLKAPEEDNEDDDIVVVKNPPKKKKASCAPVKKRQYTKQTTEAPTKKKKVPKPKPEKRLKRKRTCTQSVLDRIKRALRQRLYMVSWEQKGPHMREYKVLGSTGNLYTIQIGKLITCSCPDFRKGNLCKHCLFIMLKVLKVDRNNWWVWQRALLTSELDQIFAAAPDLNMLRGVQADAKTRKAVKKATGTDDGEDEDDSGKQKPLEGNDCPICLEDYTSADKCKVVWCKAQCGNNIHKSCFDMYMKAPNQRSQVTCPFCRAPWDFGNKSSSGGNATSREGYMNFASTSGQSTYRDTSSYNRRRRYGYYGYGGWGW